MAGSGGSKWTPQQAAAIAWGGGSLLVSAAAGSGKTSVLAQRCVHLVCDARPRCDVSQLLVVTFTEAAAAEMKLRIELALRQRLESGGDEHLRRQLALVEHASISTLHSFCNRLLRQYFHRVGLDPAFRILDEDEAALMRLETARGLFAERYDGQDAEAFGRFVDAYGNGGDEPLVRLVIQLHAMLRSVASPDLWMQRSLERIDEGARKPLDGSDMGRALLDRVAQRLDDLLRDCRSALRSMQGLEDFPKYVGYLQQLVELAESLRATFDRRGYDALAAALRDLQLPRRPPVPGSTPNKDTAEQIVKPVQELFKEGPLFDAVRFTSSEWQEGLESILPHARILLDLVREFDLRYRREKDAVQAVDFADLEHFALRLLGEGPKLTPTLVARALHRQYQHVLVDEYQDINEVQDAILRLASRECTAATATPNLFCVGDVKQSIYGFRLAEPGRFLERQQRFRKEPKVGHVIDLQANFRSRGPLLEAINAVFERLMVKEAVEIDYDQSHRLVPMASFPNADGCFGGAPVELHYLPDRPSAAADDAEEDDAQALDLERAQVEALLVAERIRWFMGLTGGPRMQVAERDGTLRPIEYRDIVILLRATRYHADQYAEMLQRRGIPVHNDSGGGYFDSMEVRDVLAVLRLLDNQRQDIPLAAVLRGPLAAMPEPEDSLARIRLAYPDATLPFHEAVARYATEKDDELAARLRDFLAELGDWREMARHRPVADVIWAIYERTGLLAYYSGLPSGPQRCANLIKLYERARQFGTFSRQGLYRFNRFLESLGEEVDAPQASEQSEAENVVRIMSIHRSKGLEFPVVIVPQLGKRINDRSSAGTVVGDRTAGLGLSAVDLNKQVRYPSLAQVLVSEQLRRQMLAEEMRILYVAMTRAREHLVLVGTCRSESADRWSRAWDRHEGPLPAGRILQAGNMLDWLGPVGAMLSADEQSAICIYDHPAEEVLGWGKAATTKPDQPALLQSLGRLEPLSPPPPPDEAAQRTIERLQFVYPHAPFSSLEAARSVTTWTKHEVAATTKATMSMPGVAETLKEPRCLRESQPLEAADRGTAVHLFLEHLDLARPCDPVDLAAQVRELVERCIMVETQAAAVDLETVSWFLASDVGRLLRERSGELLRELPLNYAVPPQRFGLPASDDPLDQVMIRGRIDLLIPDEHGFVLVDYKTDRVEGSALRERVELYRGQVDLYREAIQRITTRPVHTVFLIFLAAREIVKL